MAGEADRMPEFPPDNELPASLELGPLVWRSLNVGVTVAGFQVYSTGVFFTLIARSKGPNLQKEDPLWGQPNVLRASWDAEPPAGSLRLGVRDTRIFPRGHGRSGHRLDLEAWTPFPLDGDVFFHLEWPAEGIGSSEFRVPRSAAARAVVLWPVLSRDVVRSLAD
jgi:hypothetical protein